MKEAVGGSYILNIIIVFIVIVFAFLIATVLYYRAYKVNVRIANSIEKYEGYNRLSYDEINRTLKTIGYTRAKAYNFSNSDCEIKQKTEAMTNYTPEYMYCIYQLSINDDYYKYGILTYIKFELPFLDLYFKIPIYTETERIYYFNETTR